MKASLVLIALTLGLSSAFATDKAATEQAPAANQEVSKDAESVIKHKKATEEQAVEVKEEATSEENN